MGKEMAKTQSEKQITKTPKIRASVNWWARLEAWMAVHGYQSVPEGLRAAVNKCTEGTDPSQV